MQFATNAELPNTGRNCLYHNDGGFQFTKVTTGVVVTDAVDPDGGVWADFDNDGFLDLFVCNQAGPSLLYHNERDGTFSQVTEGELVNDDGHHYQSAFADFDNGGFLDLYVSHEDYDRGFLPEPNSLYRNEGNSNGWTIVRLVGTVSNRAAIGAKIRTQATLWGKPVWQLRQVSGGEGSQNDLRAHFGLGDATNVTTLRIEWPSGIVQEFTNVAANQIPTIPEAGQVRLFLDSSVLLAAAGSVRNSLWAPPRKGTCSGGQSARELRGNHGGGCHPRNSMRRSPCLNRFTASGHRSSSQAMRA